MKQDRARTITERLLRTFGLKTWRVHLVNFPPMPDERKVEDGIAWTRPRRRLGLCSYRSRTLSLSIEHVEQDDDEFVSETIAEEVSHALTPGAAHGPRWHTAFQNVKAMLAADAQEQALIEQLIGGA